MNNKKVLVTGPKGFVGRKLLQMYPDAIPSPSLRSLSEDDMRRLIEESGAEAIIHTAGMSDVGECEKDPEGSYEANVTVPLKLARAAGNIKLVCFSTGQVYVGSSGEGPYTEDMACPANVYSRHKLEMEERVLDICGDAVMLRASWMFDWYMHRDNFFTQLLTAKEPIAFDHRQHRVVTYVRETAENMPKVLGLPGGAYNYSSFSEKPLYDIAVDFLAAVGRKLEIIDEGESHHLWMNTAKAEKYGIKFSTVEDGLFRCARDYGFIK